MNPLAHSHSCLGSQKSADREDSGWPCRLGLFFRSGILSVDAPLRNFSRGLLIGSHCSGAHRRLRSASTASPKQTELGNNDGRASSTPKSFCYLQKQISRVSLAQSVGFTCGIQLLGSCVHNRNHHSALGASLFTVIAKKTDICH
jgi:hypothetical protein